MGKGRQTGSAAGDVARTVDFIEDISTRIHGVLDESEIYQILKGVFAALETLTATVLLISREGSQLKIAETTLAPLKSKKREGKSRIRLKGRRIDLNRSRLLSRVVVNRETVEASFSRAMSDWFGPPAASRLSGYGNARTRVISTPLKDREGVTGVLAVSCIGPSKRLIPTVERFARHLSTALELAREYRDRERIEEELRSSREQLRSLSGHLQSAREEERTHIAREMHDELGQTLTALKIDLSSLKSELPEGGKDFLKRLDSSLGLTDRTIQTVKRISGELRPKLLDTLGLVAAMQWQGRDFEKRTGVACAVTADKEDIILDGELSTAIFRVFQEALTNVARHAEATRVEVSLRQRGGQLELVIRDNGKGITKERIEQSGSLGLVGMRERVRYWGGEFAIEGKKSKGTTVTVTIPTEETAEHRAVSTSCLVGREKEMRKLRSALKKTARGIGKLILIHGEAGVGKTRLLAELGQGLETRGSDVLFGGCREDTRSVSYYPFREAFSRFLEVGKEEAISAFSTLPVCSKWEVGRVIPGLRSAEPADLEPAKDPFRLYEAFQLFIQKLAVQSEGPLLLAIEDLHLSDEASLGLLRYLARNLSRSAVQLCATYRTEEAPESLHRFRRSLEEEDLSLSIHLQPLSQQDVSDMVDFLCPGVEASSQFRGLLYQKTNGNPFFVVELVRLMQKADITGTDIEITCVPQSVQAVLERRIGGLDPAAREILSCGALVGEEFEFDVLRRVIHRPEMEVMEAVEVGARAHIVRESTRGEEERYRFVHGLVADALYSGIGKTRRRLWHNRVGEALERVYAGGLEELNGRLTHHFELGQNWEKAYDYALVSAKQAKETYANQEAIKLYEKARAMLPKVRRDAEEQGTAIAQGLGEIYRVTGDLEKALEEFRLAEESARSRGDQRNESEVLRSKCWVYSVQGEYDAMEKHAQTSYEMSRGIADRRGMAASLNCMAAVHMNRSDFGGALEHLEEALAISREIGDEPGIGQCLLRIGVVHSERGSYGEALSHQEASLAIFRKTGNKRGTANALVNIGVISDEKGDYEEALRRFEAALETSRETGEKSSIARILKNIATVNSHIGSHEKALGYSEEALAIDKEIGNRPGVSSALLSIGVRHWAMGSYDRALKCFEEALAISTELGDKLSTAQILDNMGIVYRVKGSYDEALRCHGQAVAISREMGHKLILTHNLANVAAVHSERGSFDEALKHLTEALVMSTEIGHRAGSALVLRDIGSVHANRGDYAEGLKCFEESLKIHREIGEKKGMASALSSMGDVYQDVFDLEKAKGCHGEALELIEGVGAKDDEIVVRLGVGIDKQLSGDNEKALECLSEIGEVVEKSGMKRLEPRVLAALSEVWLAKKDFAKTIEFCDKLLGMTGKTGLKPYHTRGKWIKGEMLLSRARAMSDTSSKKTRARILGAAEAELKEAVQLAEEIGAKPLLWRVCASLGSAYKELGDDRASEQFRRARVVIEEIASRVGDEKLKDTFLNSQQVRSVFTQR